eukprot:CAMPEP_0206029990 /NCGR_PEP_ID=MMETSP1464-20131121/47290_1 /ASSEMBLY_ACC=CAM_ASM_001124 /TAXON_ID=119497 /ORGANISM="Exanthemachrysis gayraliae, Strain RCC1523" /LENGTH=260 /DNA_ID=CAMNT_0053404089 /DNA_START=21 /DNA_END=803 /DNA_ORIENTATION=+
MAQRLAYLGAGVAVGYCLPKIHALTPATEPVEKALLGVFPKPAISLSYFDVSGRAEMVRWTLALGGVRFEDVRFSHAEWPEHKKQIITGQAPAARVDGSRPYAQSYALLRFAGRLAGLYPTDPVKALAVDEVLGVSEDLAAAMLAPRAMEPAFKQVSASVAAKQKAALLSSINEDALPRYFGVLEKLLEANGTGWFVGAAPTVADVAVATVVRIFTTGFAEQWGYSPEVPKGYPRVMAMSEALERLPPVKKWIEDHPEKA